MNGPLDVVSLFGGIGGIDLAFERAGMSTRLICEKDKHCRKVLAARFPDAVLHPDVTELTADDLRRAGAVPGRTVITAGWPCQGNSVAGKRGGMADPRSGLWSQVARLLGEFRPAWFVGENVPGLLSVNDGRDFGVVVQDLAELGYGFSWRVLDARHFGVPQRRRRVIVVGHLGGTGATSGQVLLEPEGLRWDSAESSEARTLVTARARESVAVGVLGAVSHALTAEGADASEDGTGRGTPVITYAPKIATALTALTAREAKGPDSDATTVLLAFDSKAGGGDTTSSGAFSVDETPTLPTGPRLAVYLPDTAATLTAGVSKPGVSAPGRRQEDDTNLVSYVADEVGALLGGGERGYRVGAEEAAGGQLVAHPSSAYPLALRGRDEGADLEMGEPGDPAFALRTGNGGSSRSQLVAVQQSDVVVRRLTPLECERLQGFPDGWTDLPGASDSQRYRQLGNSVAVPVLTWVGLRVAAVDASERVA